jgi:hypothetical protein
MSAFGIWFTFGSLYLMLINPFKQDYGSIYILVSLMVFSWIALMVISISWVQDRKVNKAWPLVGTIAGFISLFFTVFPLNIIFIFPALVLALYLVLSYVNHSWHQALIHWTKSMLYLIVLLPLMIGLFMFILNNFVKAP